MGSSVDFSSMGDGNTPSCYNALRFSKSPQLADLNRFYRKLCVCQVSYLRRPLVNTQHLMVHNYVKAAQYFTADIILLKTPP